MSDLVNIKACIHLLAYLVDNPQRPKMALGLCRLILIS